MADFKTRFSSKKQDFETPDNLFNLLNDEFHFTLDVCANSDNKKCKRYFSEQQNGLVQKWEGTCWMNPPFIDVGRWVKKAYGESQDGTVVVCLLPSRTNTGWWHDYVMQGEIRFIRGRPKFKGSEHGLPLPLSIVIFRKENTEQKFGQMELEL